MRQQAIWSSVVLCASALGCAGKTFVRVDPPITAQGVQIALAQEECGLDQDPMVPDTFVLDLSLTMRVTNGAPDALKFHPERSRLVIAGRETAADDHAEELSIGAGSKKDLHVRFIVKGKDVACNNAMSVALDKAMELGGKPLPLSPIAFQPSNTPDT